MNELLMSCMIFGATSLAAECCGCSFLQNANNMLFNKLNCSQSMKYTFTHSVLYYILKCGDYNQDNYDIIDYQTINRIKKQFNEGKLELESKNNKNKICLNPMLWNAFCAISKPEDGFDFTKLSLNKTKSDEVLSSYFKTLSKTQSTDSSYPNLLIERLKDLYSIEITDRQDLIQKINQNSINNPYITSADSVVKELESVITSNVITQHIINNKAFSKEALPNIRVYTSQPSKANKILSKNYQSKNDIERF